jgi:hypothetical protein
MRAWPLASTASPFRYAGGVNPPVAQFIKSCARAALDDAHLDTVNAELDWELVLEIALRHGMMPLVYRAL